MYLYLIYYDKKCDYPAIQPGSISYSAIHPDNKCGWIGHIPDSKIVFSVHPYLLRRGFFAVALSKQL